MPDLESAIDALYREPLEAFTAARNALAASLKKAGDKAGAERVKALAKPSVTAWAVNQAWWRHRARVEALIAAGARQRDAHVAWASGQAADVREAGEARQKAVSDVTEAALEALGGPKAVAPDVQYRIAGTIEALASSGWPPAEGPGRLVRDVQASGLDALSALAAAAAAAPPSQTPGRPRQPGAGLTVVPGGRAGEPKEPLASPAAPHEGTMPQRKAPVPTAAAQARLDEAVAALERARTAATEAAAGEGRAREALESAVARRTSLESALDDARAEEAAARRAVSQAATAASRAEMDLARAERDELRARQAVH